MAKNHDLDTLTFVVRCVLVGAVVSTLVCTRLAGSTGAEPFGPPAHMSDAQGETGADAPMGPPVDVERQEAVGHHAPVPLRAEGEPTQQRLGSARLESRPIVRSPEASSSGQGAWWLRTAGALVLVIGLIVLLRLGLVRMAGLTGGLGSQMGAGGRAPSGLLEVLGRYPVARGQTLVLLKVDRRVLLLCQSSGGFTTLSEISEPDDVASILIKARDEEGESLTARFNSLLGEVEREQGLLDQPISLVEREMKRAADGEPEADPARSLRKRLMGLRGERP